MSPLKVYMLSEKGDQTPIKMDLLQNASPQNSAFRTVSRLMTDNRKFQEIPQSGIDHNLKLSQGPPKTIEPTNNRKQSGEQCPHSQKLDYGYLL